MQGERARQTQFSSEDQSRITRNPKSNAVRHGCMAHLVLLNAVLWSHHLRRVVTLDMPHPRVMKKTQRMQHAYQLSSKVLQPDPRWLYIETKQSPSWRTMPSIAFYHCVKLSIQQPTSPGLLHPPLPFRQQKHQRQTPQLHQKRQSSKDMTFTQWFRLYISIYFLVVLVCFVGLIDSSVWLSRGQQLNWLKRAF